MSGGGGDCSWTGQRPSNPACYTLTETQTAGFLDGRVAVSTRGDTPGNDVFSAIVLNAGVSGANNNFGELPPASLSGFVYDDSADNDGVKQGAEPGIGNVTVTLT